MKTCPVCHSTFADNELFCGNCGTKLVESQPAKQSKTPFIIAVVIAIAAVAAVGWLYLDTRYDLSEAKYELRESKRELTNVESKLEKANRELEKLDDLTGLYGYGSENYYADKSVVVLKKSESKNITIYANLDNTIWFRASNSGISCEWGEWVLPESSITITGNQTGYYTVGFGNNANDDSFEILVIVTE